MPKLQSSIPAFLLLLLFLLLMMMTLHQIGRSAVTAAAAAEMQTIRLSVLEEQPARTLVGDLRKLLESGSDSNPEEGGQRSSSSFFFRQPHRSPYNLFSIVQSTGHLVTTRAVNREHVCGRDSSSSSSSSSSSLFSARNPLLDEPCLLVLDLHRKSSGHDSSSFPSHPSHPHPPVRLEVEIVDVNDNPPLFYQPLFSLEVPEGAPVGSLFRLPLAIDFDSGENSVQDYRLESEEADSESPSSSSFHAFPFSLVYDESESTSEMELNLKLILPLDRESTAGYRAVVVAVDGGSPPKSGSMTLDVRVADQNDNAPRFDSDSGYRVEVGEGLPVGSTLLRLYAEDPDVGENGRVEYRLVGSSEEAHGDVFALGAETGSLTLRSSLDYESVRSYQLVVQALDHGAPRRTSFVGVTVDVTDENDNSPRVAVTPLAASGRFEVEENSAQPRVGVAYLHAVDPDEGKNGEVSCSILTVVASDSTEVDDDDDVRDGYLKSREGSETSSDYYQDDDPNPNPPPPSPPPHHHRHRRRFDRDLPYGNGSPKAGAGPLGSSAEPVDPASLFRLEHYFNADYKLETTASLDRERAAGYRLAIECMDGGSEPRRTVATIDVRVLDVNDNEPRFESESLELTVEEGAPLGTLLAVLSASDPDEGDNGRLAYDIEPLTKSTQRDPSSSSSSSFGETDPLGSSRRDPDRSNRRHHQQLNHQKQQQQQQQGQQHHNMQHRPIADCVRLDRSTGRLYTACPLDYETMPSTTLRFRVSAVDHGAPGWEDKEEGGTGERRGNSSGGGRRSRWIPLTVVVLDEDDESPEFDRAAYSFDASESSDPGHAVGKVTATDADDTEEFNRVEYGLMPPGNEREVPFRIDPATGVIRTSARLDREQKDSYLLTVTAFNPLPLPPSLASPGWDPRPPRRRPPAALVNVSVSVLDSNDNPPIFIFPETFRLSRVSMPLGAEAGSHVTTAVAADADRGENALVRYSISRDSGESAASARYFAVDRLTGEVTNLLPLVEERSYRLLLLAEDGGEPRLSATAELLVSVNGSLAGKGAALKSEGGGSRGVVEDPRTGAEAGGSAWFGLEERHHLPLLLATCCGAVGVLALLLAVAVVVLCRKKRISDRKLRKRAARAKVDSMNSSRNITGSPTCELSCDESDKCRWPEGAEAVAEEGGVVGVEGGGVGEKWRRPGSVPSFNARQVCSSSDRCLNCDLHVSRSDRQRCPGVGGCESDRSCGDFCSSYVGVVGGGIGGGYTDCESCKESLAEAADDELCHLKAKSCCQVNQDRRSKPDLTTGICHQPLSHHHHDHHNRHHHLPLPLPLPHHPHPHPHHQHQHHPRHQPSQRQQPHFNLPLPTAVAVKQTHFPLVEGRRGNKKKTPRSRVRCTQLSARGIEANDLSSPVKVDDYSGSDMSGSFYCDSGLDSDRMPTATRSS